MNDSVSGFDNGRATVLAGRASGTTARKQTRDCCLVLIVGAGFAGLGMAIGLKQAGVHDFVVLEKADRVGGTWRENTYPGCGCDVMSLMYSYSFAPNRRRTRMYARQGEILDYIERTADEYDVTGHIRFGTEVTGYDFDEAADEWKVSTASGEILRARIVVAGAGPLHRPHIPELPGLGTFGGTTFHSARWNHDHDLTGRWVAMIGTGASAVQFIPRVARAAARVEVFQRTVWNAGGCDSWYLDEKGFNRAAWPGSSVSVSPPWLRPATPRWRRMRAPRRNDFDIVANGGSPSEVHRGPATLIAGDTEIPVEVHLAGHIEPIDGSYRWKGRITAHPAVTALHAAGDNQVRIRIPGGTESTARLAEIDPWGNTRVTGTGQPPYPTPA